MNKGFSTFKFPTESLSVDINVDGLKQCLMKSDDPKSCIKKNIKVPLKTKRVIKSKMHKLKELAMKNKPEMVHEAESLMKHAMMMEHKANAESQSEMEHKAKMENVAAMKHKAAAMMEYVVKSENAKMENCKKENFDNDKDSIDVLEDEYALEEDEDTEDGDEMEHFATENAPTQMPMQMPTPTQMPSYASAPFAAPTQVPVAPASASGYDLNPGKLFSFMDNKTTVFVVIIAIYLIIMLRK